MYELYDLISVFNPTTQDDKLEAFIERISKKITSAGGTIEKASKNGLRKVNTRMRKYKNIRDGYFIEISFKAPANIPQEITSTLRVNEDIMRFILTKAIPKIVIPEEKSAEETVEINPEMLIGKPE